MRNYEMNTISVNDILHVLRECDRNERYEGMFEHMLTFASELTGISEDSLSSSMYDLSVESRKDIQRKYSVDRAEMDEDEERRFVEDCFKVYEKEGFSSVFWSPFSDHEERKGQKFEVVKRCSSEDRDLCTLPMWKIKFLDGMVIDAYPEEIIPSEMRANGCRLFDEKGPAIDTPIQSTQKKTNGVSALRPLARETEIDERFSNRSRMLLFSTLELLRKEIQPHFSDWKDADDWLFAQLDFTKGELAQIYEGRDALYYDGSAVNLSEIRDEIDDNWLHFGQKVKILNDYFKDQVGTIHSFMWNTGNYIVTMENGHNIPFSPSELEKVENIKNEYDRAVSFSDFESHDNLLDKSSPKISLHNQIQSASTRVIEDCSTSNRKITEHEPEL